ncbi:MAG: fibrobacter succinogenes major paralogous domain-containing protein, partial [Prolixibacteraceae bacterium]|nr:fibrobacter succinogenes major paralogous domain-containing protein [Prolixibacteraceae bacterium]
YPPYYYQWSNGLQTQNLIDVEAGNYQITLNDNSGQSIRKMIALSDSVYDYDGNAYSYVKIGQQVWMQQNLRVAQTPNGTRVLSYAYNNDESLTEVYGRLYTWPAAMNGAEMEMAQGICPDGWHIPSDEEFKILEMELGMTRAEADMVNTWRGNGVGTAMKAGGSSGFNVMLSGRREANGAFKLMGNTEYIWTSTSYEDSYAWRRCFSAYDKTVGRWNTFPKSYGFSVRCVKNAKN